MPKTHPPKRPIGDARVSTHGQTLDAQLEQLCKAGCAKIYRHRHQSGRLMIAVVGGLADVERDLIRTRTAEGRARAKARGQHRGRPPKLTPQQQREARRRRPEGATLKELAKSYNVGRSTISRL
ncbi:MAG: recombinase family protein [Sinobacteraceae bacterium]|nr:recombinase family protein [Nevskiaceae bacterium]